MAVRRRCFFLPLRFHQGHISPAGDGGREVEPFEATIQRSPAQAQHLGGGLLVAVRTHERPLDVIALDVDQ